MRKAVVFCLLGLAIAIQPLKSQDLDSTDKRSKNRYAIWFIPSASANIYGLALGPIGSEAICNRPYTKYSHGLNVQIPGQGILQTFMIGKLKLKDLDIREADAIKNDDSTFYKKAHHNGILVSVFGTFTDQVNGMSLSLWMSMGRKMNGFSVNLWWSVYEQVKGASIALVNHSAETKGVQIGLVNKTKKLRGFQFGLWNKNEKRSLPIINWNFKD